MEGSDVCFSPVLTMTEAIKHPHAVARNAFVEIDGVNQPAPAPRFQGTPTATPSAPPPVGMHTQEVLLEYGYSAAEVKKMMEDKAVAGPKSRL